MPSNKLPSIKVIERLVLDHVQNPNYRPVKPKTIAKKLDLPESATAADSLRSVKRAIKELIKRKELVWGPQHLVKLSDKKKTKIIKEEKKNPLKTPTKKRPSNEVIGVFRRAMAGYGFVTPSESHPQIDGADVFIPLPKTGDASDGDSVRVRLSRSNGKKNEKPQGRKPKVGKEKAEKRFSGRIVEVLDRRTNQFVGSYLERGGLGLVRVDGKVFETDILVGDAGAKNCRVGDKVVIEMVNFPSSYDEGEGVIVEVLGPRGQAGVDTMTIIREFGLPGEFPEKVLEEARKQAELFDDDKIPEDRTDFTTDTVATIDPKEARDFDDAISLEQLENGHWRLGVHIADVSHFVPKKSALDDEAFARATSVYLPDKVIPMLPEIISNNLASLQPKRNRYTMTAVIEFTADGAPVSTDLHRGVINSAHRFNYEEIDEYLEDDQPWKEKLSVPVFDLVRRMHTLAMILRRRRMDRGSIELTLPEVKIILDDDGRACGAKQVENTESHQIIEEFMLAANEAVAREMVDRGLFLIRRIHEPPSAVKLKDLNAFIKSVGIQADSLQDRFEMKRVVAQAKGLPEERAIHFAVLRSMQKAIYSPKEVGHYALASKEYCHFTSPIRRYPDLIVHRMAAEIIKGKKPPSDFEHLTRQGNHCSMLEQRAEQAERSLIRLKLLNMLIDRAEEEFEAVITGVESFGLFAQLDEIPVDGLVPTENLPSDRYEFDRGSRSLSGFRSGNTFRLGDRVQVRVKNVDPDRRELELELLQVLKSSPARNSNPTNSKPTSSKPTSSKRSDHASSNSSGSVYEVSTSRRKKKSVRKKTKAQKKKKATGKKTREPSKRKSKAAAKKRLTSGKSGRPSKKKR